MRQSENGDMNLTPKDNATSRSKRQERPGSTDQTRKMWETADRSTSTPEHDKGLHRHNTVPRYIDVVTPKEPNEVIQQLRKGLNILAEAKKAEEARKTQLEKDQERWREDPSRYEKEKTVQVMMMRDNNSGNQGTERSSTTETSYIDDIIRDITENNLDYNINAAKEERDAIREKLYFNSNLIDNDKIEQKINEKKVMHKIELLERLQFEFDLSQTSTPEKKNAILKKFKEDLARNLGKFRKDLENFRKDLEDLKEDLAIASAIKSMSEDTANKLADMRKSAVSSSSDNTNSRGNWKTVKYAITDMLIYCDSYPISKRERLIDSMKKEFRSETYQLKERDVARAFREFKALVERQVIASYRLKETLAALEESIQSFQDVQSQT